MPGEAFLSPHEIAETYVVQKFGGTSVGKYALNIVDDIVRSVSPSTAFTVVGSINLHRPTASVGKVVVVCSARSSSSKIEGTTNR